MVVIHHFPGLDPLVWPHVLHRGAQMPRICPVTVGPGDTSAARQSDGFGVEKLGKFWCKDPAVLYPSCQPGWGSD